MNGPSSGPVWFTLGQVARATVIIILVVAVALLTWKLFQVLVLAFGGVIFGLILDAVGMPLRRWVGLGRGTAVVLAVILLLALLGLMVWLVGDRVAGETDQMRQQIPNAIHGLQDWLGESEFGRHLIEGVQGLWRGGSAVIEPLTSAAKTTVRAVTYGLLMFFLGIYLAADPDMYRRGLISLFPPNYRSRADEGLRTAGLRLRLWLLGQLLAMVIVGVVTGTGLWLLGIPLALSLGLLAGILEFVPIVGPIISSIPAILIAFTRSPGDALYTALLFIGIHQAEGNLLMPIVQRWAVSLPPALGVLAMVALSLLVGVLGVIFATPLVVVAITLVDQLYVKDALGGAPAGPRQGSSTNGSKGTD